MTHSDRTSDANAPVLAEEITEYYERGGEFNRLREGDGRLAGRQVGGATGRQGRYATKSTLTGA